MDKVRVRLIRKLAERINDIDLSGCAIGDILDLPLHSARLLIVEGWAVPVDDLLPDSPDKDRPGKP